MNRRASFIHLCTFLLFFFFVQPCTGQTPSSEQTREKALAAYQNGNYREAYEILRTLLETPKADPEQISENLTMAIRCQKNLGLLDEFDQLLERTVSLHQENRELLRTAAQELQNISHYGYLIGGQFNRGSRKSSGRYVSSEKRDRVRATRLALQATRLVPPEMHRDAPEEYYQTFLTLARTLKDSLARGHYWKLQALTIIDDLPDYEEPSYDYYQGGAPVDSQGKPIFYARPESYEDAANDGERWRWALAQASRAGPEFANKANLLFADFLRQQIGVQTLQQYRWFADRRSSTVQKDTQSAIFSLDTLRDNETIARLATGIKRFPLPEQHNFILLYQRVASSEGKQAETALNNLAQIYANRRQFPKAAKYWQASIKRFGAGRNNFKQKQLDQIVGAWGAFEPISSQPAGKTASIEYRFRNGTNVTFDAHEIRIKKLLEDVQEYLESDPETYDWNRFAISNLGYRLVTKNQTEYLGKRTARWREALTPLPGHEDRRVTVSTPLKKAGAYLLTARMAGGNTSKIILWLQDTMIISKPLKEKTLYYVANAVTGEPIANAELSLFGYKQKRSRRGRDGKVRTYTMRSSAKTDSNGLATFDETELPSDYLWLATAQTDDGHFAFMGYSHLWYRTPTGENPDDQIRLFPLTSQPVYRPGQQVKFKVWARLSRYDLEDVSTLAEKSLRVAIVNPRREKVFEERFTADAYGGINGQFDLPEDAVLGTYVIELDHGYAGTFRVEEYKKPEFEVLVEAPDQPVSLGDTITAKIKASYYFGAPVTQAKVKYKVLRYSHDADWFPSTPWDWLYGQGYWWFAEDAPWYPGWRSWGMSAPSWRYSWLSYSFEQPELVQQQETEIGPDGTVTITIDTSIAKELQGDKDHRYEITAEVVDQSRRTIIGQGEVIASRKPFSVYCWVNRGHYRSGDTVKAEFSAKTIDHRPVEGKGALKLFRIRYDQDGTPQEALVEKWELNTDKEGRAKHQLKAAQAGQYRLSYEVTDKKGHTIEGGYLFSIIGTDFKAEDYRFNEIELIPDRYEFAPGDTLRLMINTNASKSTVLLFVRPVDRVYPLPEILSMEDKSRIKEIAVTKADMPNFYVEALTIRNSKIHSTVREIYVPPEKRMLNVEVIPSAEQYRPGEKATLKLKITDFLGKPLVGSVALAVYDRALEYISGGSNVNDIRHAFWDWKRYHEPETKHGLLSGRAITPPGEEPMKPIGAFGGTIRSRESRKREAKADAEEFEGYMDLSVSSPVLLEAQEPAKSQAEADGVGSIAAPTAVRKDFADSVFWEPALETNQNGLAEVSFPFADNLTSWKIKAWTMAHGTRVGEGEADVVTAKSLLLRLQAPRFFVERDEVVLSANVHNYLAKNKSVQVKLELQGQTLTALEDLSWNIAVEPSGEKRVDWRVRADTEGEAIVRMFALSDEESDAVEKRFPVYVHGMDKVESFSGSLGRTDEHGKLTFDIPQERRPELTQVELRYSPSLAGAMVDALPYLVSYPYGCTEQTLNRFLPTVVVQKILQDMGLNLRKIREKRTNLNAQEIGQGKERAKGWKRFKHNPVFNEEEVARMAREGLERLSSMQVGDGGWGWFSGRGERSYPHTTALVVHGLQLAKKNGISPDRFVLRNGIQWLLNYQAGELQKLTNASSKTKPWKDKADHVDAFVYMVLADAGKPNSQMIEALYRDRTNLSVYAKAMLGLSLHREGRTEELEMILKNIEQYLVQDQENQTAYLRLPNDGYWWNWYGSEVESHAYYLKLLSRTDPEGKIASGLAKYLINNRKHATYWSSTRDTAVAIEALAEYMKASKEDAPDLTLQLYFDGQKKKEVEIDRKNLFFFDNKLLLSGEDVSAGSHQIEIRKQGRGPLYYNAYVRNFTLEDFLTKAGLEVKVERKYYKLYEKDAHALRRGAKGQALQQKVEKYERRELKDLAQVTSGDLVEIELLISTKNDYEYLIFEDMKPAGFEPIDVRSGYTRNELGAYVEFRDNRVVFFVRRLDRGSHSVSYRMRAEIPGKFSALPTRASGMYAPELRANSDEIRLRVVD